MPTRKTAVFRLDAGLRVGSGHLMRCSGLAEALTARGWKTIFAMRGAPSNSGGGEFDVLALKGPPTEEAAEIGAALPRGCDLLIVDHYGHDIGFETASRSWASKVLAFDDFPDRYHDCDFLLDQTIGRTHLDYRGRIPTGCQTILGADFVQLRGIFQRYAGRRITPALQPRNLLVTFGGSDPTDQTSKARRAMQGSDMMVSLVTGPENPRNAAISLDASSAPNMTVYHAPSDISSHMETADMALSASGSTCWELAFMGVPTVIIVTADNQRAIAERLDAAGVAESLGWHADVEELEIADACAALRGNHARRREMSEKGRLLVDGRGAERAADILDAAIQ